MRGAPEGRAASRNFSGHGDSTSDGARSGRVEAPREVETSKGEGLMLSPYSPRSPSAVAGRGNYVPHVPPTLATLVGAVHLERTVRRKKYPNVARTRMIAAHCVGVCTQYASPKYGHEGYNFREEIFVSQFSYRRRAAQRMARGNMSER